MAPDGPIEFEALHYTSRTNDRDDRSWVDTGSSPGTKREPCPREDLRTGEQYGWRMIVVVSGSRGGRHVLERVRST